MVTKEDRIKRYEKAGYTKLSILAECSECYGDCLYITQKGFIVCANCGYRYRV